MNNPDFLPRLKKYWKNTWASTNQRILGRYCVIDAVMDLYLVDAVRSIKLNGKEYTEDSYMVYLYNQYLAAQITSSGITVDIPYLNKLKEFYERLYFNTMICISQFVTYTRRELIQQDKEYIRLDNIPDKIRILLEDYRTTFFLQTDPVKMAKEFVNFLCDSPEAFERVITKYRAELNDLYETALAVHNERQDDTLKEEERAAEAELKKLLRKKTVFVQKAAYIREDLELPQFFTEFNRKYLEKTNSNSIILFDYWNGKPESKLVEYLKHGTLRKTGLNEKICEKLEEYIWDIEQLTKPDVLLKSLNIYLYDSYILEYEKIADRKITDPIDHSLDKLIIYDFNKSRVRDEIALDLQKAYEIPITISGLFYSFRNQADKMDMFTKSGFIRFRDSVISRCNQTCKGRFELMNHMHERMYEKVEEKGEYGKVLSVSERRKVWTAGGDDGYGGKSTWDGLKIYLYKDEPFVPDLTFRHIPEDKVECFNKFFGYMEMNRGAEKVLSSTITPIIEHSYNYVTKDRMHIQWKKKQHDPEQPQMYQIDIHPNSVHTGRWASNFHTLPPEDDGRLSLKFQKGYVGSYFDISQAEPRSICYISRDPDFMELYDSGKDAYMELAKIAFPHHMNDKALIKMHRKQCKGIILSGLYGRGIKGLAMSLGIPVEEANQIWTSFIGRFTTVAKFKDRLLKFAKANGRVDTILGNRIPVSEERVHTSSMNYVIQGFTAIILAAGFYNSVAEAVKHGIDVSVKGVVHDSSTCEFPIRHILHMDLHYRKFFREWIRHWWNPDYKYDLDLLMDYRHYCPYRFDLESGTVTLNMWTGYADEFLEYLSQGYSFKVTERKDIVQKDYKGGARNDIVAR